MLPVATAALATGFWYAQRASTSMVGEGLYWKTTRWLGNGEHAANRKYNAALAQSKADGRPLDLADHLEKNVLPFWHQASDRLAAIDLEPGSPHLATVESLEDFVDAKVSGYEHFAEGIRNNDPEETRAAIEALRDIDETPRKSNESQ
jgi:hypothetical protein